MCIAHGDISSSLVSWLNNILSSCGQLRQPDNISSSSNMADSSLDDFFAKKDKSKKKTKSKSSDVDDGSKSVKKEKKKKDKDNPSGSGLNRSTTKQQVWSTLF